MRYTRLCEKMGKKTNIGCRLAERDGRSQPLILIGMMTGSVIESVQPVLLTIGDVAGYHFSGASI